MHLPEDSFIQEITLEAPGDFLSELLGVPEARVIQMDGTVHTLPESAHWRVLAPLEGTLRIAAGECRLGMLCLCGAAADRVFQSTRASGGLYFERGGEAVQRMLRVLSARNRRASAKEASELAYGLLMALHGTGSAGPAGRHSLPQVVEAALGVMRQDYAFLEGIAELAERLEVSQEYLTRCFCKYTGITPGKYLNQVRIENAKLLLRQGQHTVQFVSDACGFANANYFARVFRKYVGVNPREYARAQEPGSAPGSGEDSLYVL